MYAIHEGATMQRDSFIEIARIDSVVECRNIAPDPIAAERKFIGAARLKDIFAEVVAKPGERRAQRASGPLRIELRPEEGGEFVAPVEAPGSRGGEVRQQSDPLGLPQSRF
jgi:hypothetical protein